jgi:hypothetical protein
MKTVMTFRLDPSVAAELRRATERPMAPTMTGIVERGIRLALAELEGGKRGRVLQRKI